MYGLLHTQPKLNLRINGMSVKDRILSKETKFQGLVWSLRKFPVGEVLVFLEEIAPLENAQPIMDQCA